jgi:hypothetical protein
MKSGLAFPHHRHGRLVCPRIGRKEIVMFFYLYFIIELLAIFLDSGIIPTASNVYPVRAYLFHNGTP